jgi:hypothetical protein
MKKLAFDYINNDSVKEKAMKGFHRYHPPRLKKAIENNLSEDERDLANGLDFLDFHVRLYISGSWKTLHRVYYELRYQSRSKGTLSDIEQVFNEIEDYLLKHEIYELMSRFNVVKEKSISFFTQIQGGKS